MVLYDAYGQLNMQGDILAGGLPVLNELMNILFANHQN